MFDVDFGCHFLDAVSFVTARPQRYTGLNENASIEVLEGEQKYKGLVND